MSPSDAELILESQRDPNVFCQLYERWADKVLAYFYRRTLDPEDSADLVAETFAAAYQRRGKFRDKGKPGSSWLFGIARNELGQYRRRRRVELRAVRRIGIQLPRLDDESIERIEALIDMEAYAAKLKVALRQLGPKEQDALRLRVLEDMDYRGIAEALGCSEGAARVRVHRGLTRLSHILEAPA
ncbi:MAG: sigma-70 family RNA polymerase sigma factor [SAR202 cluster bacterium]|jgi:RNA polymerase sigma-70 factor (ECF subfamily)|nr:sigma-70 family RNA polymerase sigma factor [SAR202 cluster bacterium]